MVEVAQDGQRTAHAARAVWAALAIMIAGVTSSAAGAATKVEKSFGKWGVVCIEPDNEAKNCTMMQTHVRANQESNNLVLRWAITNQNREQTQALIVPTGVSIKEGIRVFLGDAEPIVMDYTFCGARVCIASAPLDTKLVAAIKSGKKASASYVLGSKRLVQVDLELDGFGEAYDFIAQQLS